MAIDPTTLAQWAGYAGTAIAVMYRSFKKGGKPVEPLVLPPAHSPESSASPPPTVDTEEDEYVRDKCDELDRELKDLKVRHTGLKAAQQTMHEENRERMADVSIKQEETLRNQRELVRRLDDLNNRITRMEDRNNTQTEQMLSKILNEIRGVKG